MSGKWSRIFFFAVSVVFVANTCAYQNGPVGNRIVYSYTQGYKSFFECQKNVTKVLAALAFGISVPGVPSVPISDRNVSFLLYTRKNPKIPQILRVSDSIELLKNSNLNFAKETVLYVHGSNGTFDAGAKNFSSRLLPYKDINVIVTNFDSYAYFNESYSASITYPRLGGIVAKLIQKFTKIGANRKKIHLLGFSAGGEVVAYAGKLLNPKVGRITVSDPQGNCFNLLPPTERISKMDADFVQIIHCDIGENGIFTAVRGDVTFVINGGLLQPQCTYLKDLTRLDRCSHLVCEDLLYRSLSQNVGLIGVKCDSYLDYLFNRCNNNDRLILRYDVPTSARGVYYVETLPSQNHEPRDYN